MEARDAQIAREMHNSGDWVIPRWNSQVLAWKPPVYHWFAAISYGIFGEVNEFTSRFPSVVCGIVGVLAVFVFGAVIFSRWTGFFAGLILATSQEYFKHARSAQTDIFLCVFTLLSLGFFFVGYLRYRKSEDPEGGVQSVHGPFLRYKIFYLISYFFMGWATLSKGPAGVVVPSLVIFVYLLAQGNLKHLAQMAIPWGVPVYLGVVAIWYFPVWLRGGNAFIYELVIRQSFIRYLNAFDHVRPFWKYFQYLAAHFLPWFAFLPGAIMFIFSQGHSRDKRRKYIFLLIWLAVIFVFYSVSQSKRSVYILALYPACALMVGRFFDAFIKHRDLSKIRRKMIASSVAYGVILLLIASALIYLAVLGEDVLEPFQKGINTSGQQAVPDLVTQIADNTSLTSLLILLLLAGAGASTFGFAKKQEFIAFFSIVAVVIILQIFYLASVSPIIEKYRDLRPFCKRLEKKLEEQDVRLGFYNNGETKRQTIVYYLGRPVHMFLSETIGLTKEEIIKLKKADDDALRDFLVSEKKPLLLIRKEDISAVEELTGMELELVDESGVSEVGFLSLVTRK